MPAACCFCLSKKSGFISTPLSQPSHHIWSRVEINTQFHRLSNRRSDLSLQVVDATAVQEECDRLIRRVVGLQEANWRLEQRTQCVAKCGRFVKSELRVRWSRSGPPGSDFAHMRKYAFVDMFRFMSSKIVARTCEAKGSFFPPPHS